MPKKTIILEIEEEKKHSVRYTEPAATSPENSLVGTVYVKKSALGPKPYPATVTLTLEW